MLIKMQIIYILKTLTNFVFSHFLHFAFYTLSFIGYFSAACI